MQPRRIGLLGGESTGKSTLARQLAARHRLVHLDLDPVAWLPGLPLRRRPRAESRAAVDAFVAAHPAWVVEGSYASLAEPPWGDREWIDRMIAADGALFKSWGMLAPQLVEFDK